MTELPISVWFCALLLGGSCYCFGKKQGVAGSAFLVLCAALLFHLIGISVDDVFDAALRVVVSLFVLWFVILTVRSI